MKRFLFTAIIFILLTAGAAGLVLQFLRGMRHTQRQPAKAAQTKITIIEGWTLDDIANSLNSDSARAVAPHLATEQEFMAEEKSFDVSKYPLLGSKPRSAGLEGFLFPDTYFLPVSAPAGATHSAILIKKALDNFTKKFTPDMQQQAAANHMSVFEIITLASIVERETGRNTVTAAQKQALDAERKTIAGIFLNRLAIGMPLESDATVNYVTKRNTPSVSAQDTQIDSPYNTYKYKGLPPGPICNPSLSSMLAVLYPATTPYLYFLHKQPSGDPVYSKTFDEHIKNKQKYLQ